METVRARRVSKVKYLKASIKLSWNFRGIEWGPGKVREGHAIKN